MNEYLVAQLLDGQWHYSYAGSSQPVWISTVASCEGDNMNEQERIAASLALTREITLKQALFVDTETWMIEHGRALTEKIVAIAQQGGRHVKSLMAAARARHDVETKSWVRAKAREHGIVITDSEPVPKHGGVVPEVGEEMAITADDVGTLTIEADGTKHGS